MIEDLTVRNLLKNGKLARAISDAAWTDLRRAVSDVTVEGLVVPGEPGR
ncbi:hypothetical protein KN815_17045 [Streptomyces sp. 4503]|uniref:Uncharacterized protein n=1 Tax=Streptomyces niphimycinicus TaxID=2842201 RepID=A0ABS6CFR6_9ACTN|nr:hypothetical protein [Streptomyces niphimycinicus]MBU3865723.1 hypothetical protein [Streptomyces niphimycinicus]